MSLLLSFLGDHQKRSVARLKVWEYRKNFCGGKWIRNICNFGIKDLPRLAQSPQLFANKFKLDLEPLALDCLEEWHNNRTYKLQANVDFNLSYYKNLPFLSRSHILPFDLY